MATDALPGKGVEQPQAFAPPVSAAPDVSSGSCIT